MLVCMACNICMHPQMHERTFQSHMVSAAVLVVVQYRLVIHTESGCKLYGCPKFMLSDPLYQCGNIKTIFVQLDLAVPKCIIRIDVQSHLLIAILM